MTKIICSPGSYIQGPGEIRKLAGYYSQLGTKGAYLIVDAFILRTYREEIVSSFEAEHIPYSINEFDGECSMTEIKKHVSQMGECDAVFGIGGGKTLDTAKGVGIAYGSSPCIIVPTAASTDAPCSRLAVLYTEDHAFDQYMPLHRNPDMVVVDTNIIAKAPVRFLMAGIGDAFATYYEAAACEKKNAVTMTGGHCTKGGMALAKLCLDTLYEDGLKAKAAAERQVCTQALENVVEANTYLSGVGFESGGLAAAHAIHNGLTNLEETHKYLHGEKVAFGALTQLVLENRSMEEIEKAVRFLKACDLPVTLADLNLQDADDAKLMIAAESACAPDDTMGNMPFEVTPEDVLSAMKAADQIAKQF
ncbi:MAG: glycerol dehydrogenase [Erysipelotrichaceae bacterium]|nr:glycerol dehydrogenase [Erysipelotrichaceae bacterium]